MKKPKNRIRIVSLTSALEPPPAPKQLAYEVVMYDTTDILSDPVKLLLPSLSPKPNPQFTPDAAIHTGCGLTAVRNAGVARSARLRDTTPCSSY